MELKIQNVIDLAVTLLWLTISFSIAQRLLHSNHMLRQPGICLPELILPRHRMLKQEHIPAKLPATQNVLRVRLDRLRRAEALKLLLRAVS